MESGGALGGANISKAGLKLNHSLQRNRLDARILILRPLETLGKSFVVEVFHNIKLHEIKCIID